MTWPDRAVLAILGGVLAYAAIEWGGVVRTGRYEYLLVLGLLAMLVSLGRARERWAPLPGGVVRWALALLPAYVLMQIVPLPVGLLRVLSPARAEGVAALDRVGAHVNFAALSVSPAATFQSFLLVCGYVIIFLLVRELTWRFGVAPQLLWRLRVAPDGTCPDPVGSPAHADPTRISHKNFGVRDLDPALSAADSSAVCPSPRPVAASKSGDESPHSESFARADLKAGATSENEALRLDERGWLAMAPLVAIGALEAILGLCQYFGGNGQQVASFGGPGEQVRWGTYANHNHYAGFLEMALPFAVVYPVALWRRRRRPGHSPVAPALGACGVWALAGLMCAGIVYSFSRMGFIAMLFSLFVMGALALGSRQLNWVARSRKQQVVTVGLVATLALAGFVFLQPDKLIARFAQLVSTDTTAGGRTQLWAETISLIRAYPAFGCGLGGYLTAFWRLKATGPLLTDDFAHNDYLQLLAELGVVGFALGATLAFAVVRTAVRKAVEAADPGARYFALACAGALAAILLHSLVDFNLYIPANAMLLAWIAGMIAGSGIADFQLPIAD